MHHAPRTSSAAPRQRKRRTAIHSAFRRRVSSPFGDDPPPRSSSGPPTIRVSGPSRRRAGSWLPTLFHRESLARSAARPNATPRALRVWGAKGQAPLVDFCNRKRTASTIRRSSEPRAPEGDRSPPSFLFASGRPPRVARPTEWSRARGGRVFTRPHLDARSLACRASPRPDGLEHLSLPTRDRVVWSRVHADDPS